MIDLKEEEGCGDGPYVPKRRPRLKRCSRRTEELAMPHRRKFLSLWHEHAYLFPVEKVNNLKQLLQRLYAMTIEETVQYFAELRAQARAEAKRKKLKQTVRKYLTEKHNEKLKNKAFRLFRRILKQGLRYAVETPVPPLLSIRLRYLSDMILEQLCDLRGLEVPNRSKCDHCGHFLISVADWTAIAAERLYYTSQLAINKISNYDFKNEDLAYQILSFNAMKSSPPRNSPQQRKFSTFSQPRLSMARRMSETPRRMSEIPRRSTLLSITANEIAAEITRRMSELQRKSFLQQIDDDSANDDSDIIERRPFFILESDSFFELPVDKDFVIRH